MGMAHAAHCHELDDIFPPMDGHLSAVAVPALIAVSEIVAVDGETAIAAYVAAAEVAGRLGEVLSRRAYLRGWHPTCVIGGVASATASARALGLNAEQTTTALSIGAGSAGGLRAQFGFNAKSLRVGMAASDGLRAALLAEQGYTASPDIFESGLCDVFGGEQSQLRGDFGGRWLLRDPGLVVKPFPSCGATHRPLRALEGALATSDAQAASVVVGLPEFAASLVDRPDPATAEDAAFSIQHCIALRLCDGAVTLAGMQQGALTRPEVVAMRKAVSVVRLDDDESDGLGPATVRIVDSAGREVDGRCETPPGGRHDPVSDEELVRRARGALGESAMAEEVIADVRELSQSSDVFSLASRFLSAT